ncbi:winged helix-turn-helix domain-containing protein [Planosporangium mesophilum]|uniref:GntR family transcriptional regulator n=1 Tax=Planosporangium mesophilum TaxID=689768 RepID=A0A8J3TE72_9ACTN|nr:winged helix-turn-helix domain-containing protein [Planosporangium mesophilum]NJC82504.1 winged helix-turn-helix transcriptional regulator [Planosporangium mesophilum]GII25495.1 GntR family transcriptional regulator [Planosporangium mesophilum]
MSVDLLDELDPDDPRPASQRIANLLRAAILTRKFAPGERLPSQNDLADRYGVARETVKTALRILRDERLIVSRQGSGAFVRAQTERPVGLRPHIEAAFERPHVAIDFAGFSGETLHGAIQEALDKIRAGRLTPESIAIRILLPDLDLPAVVPSRAEPPGDDPAVRERAARIVRRHTEAILESVRELGELGLVRSATAEVRAHGTTALFKLYILNGDEVFFGFYPVVQHTVSIDKQPVPIFDVLGKDVPLFHYTADDTDGDGTGSQYVQQARGWFDSVWTTIAHEYTP